MNTVVGGDTARFFAHDLGLVLVAKKCPHRPKAFKTVDDSLAIAKEHSFFSERADCRYS